MGKIGEYLQGGKCSIEHASQCPHQPQYLGVEEKGSNVYCEISYCEISVFIQQSPLLLGNKHLIKGAEQTRY